MPARYIISQSVLNKIYHFGLCQTAVEVTALDILISLLCGRFFQGGHGHSQRYFRQEEQAPPAFFL